jgi:signal recognition particle receptor subunit beta
MRCCGGLTSLELNRRGLRCGEIVMDAEAQTIGVEWSVEMMRRTLATWFSRLTTYVRGKEILIVGPGSAGKTKFAQYLRWGALDPEGQRDMTYGITKSPAFVMGIGREQGLTLRVRRAVDTPGQVGPRQHAKLVGRRKPHAVVVMLDCSSNILATVRWLCLFCDSLDTVLRRGSYAARGLNEIVVLLNKRDQIDNGESDELRQAVRQVLNQYLSVPLGVERVSSIPILDCVSVQTGRGTTLIDGVIAQLTERLAT